MLSRRLAENRKASSETTATSRRSELGSTVRTSTPSTSTVPSSASYSRGISITSVVLPEPVGPDERDRAAGLDLEVDVAQDGLAVAVAEAHAAQLDAPVAGG